MTDMHAMVDWAKVQVAEDEDAANVISDGGYMPQTWRHGPDAGAVGVLLFADDLMIGDPPEAIEEADAPFAIVINNRAEHHHITRWDPARVVALTKALRKALDEFSWEAREVDILAGLVEALYADRPGYQEQWRPA